LAQDSRLEFGTSPKGCSRCGLIMASEATDSDAVLADLLLTYPAVVEGRWTEISSEYAKLTGEAKTMRWLKERAKKLEKMILTTPACKEIKGSGGSELELPKEVRGCVRVFTGARGRGLQCIRDVKKGEVLIGVPEEWALVGKPDGSGGNSGQIKLALELINRWSKNDVRARSLPTSCDNPCVWSREELSWLKDSLCYVPASNQRGTLQSLYPGKKKADCTEKDFIWGMCMVQSRLFGQEGAMVYVPFCDLINSEAAPDLGLDIQHNDGHISLHATRDFKEGEEALISYHGSKAPGLFANFLAYGFVPDIVSYDELLPYLQGDTDAANLAWLLQHLEALPAEVPDEDGSDVPYRRAMANKLLRHERAMTLEHIERIKQQMESRD